MIFRSHILFAFAVAAALGGCKNGEPPKDAAPKDGKDQKKGAAIAAWIARDTTMDRSVVGVGTVLPEAVVDLRSEMAARVKSVGFQEGQAVRQGQILVKLSDEDLLATRDKAQANVVFLKQTLERRKDQLVAQAVSRQDVDAASQALAAADADLRLAQAQLAKTEIVSPVSGRIGISNVSVGQYLTPGQSVATVARLDPLKIEFQVPGDEAGKVQVGTELRFRPFGTQEYKVAKIYATDPVLDSTSRTLRVRARWQGKDDGLVPGAAVEVKLPLSRGKALLMPPQALGADARGPSVLVLRGGMATSVPVQVGRRTADAVEIVSGIAAGDTVLCNGSVPVKPGSPVTPSRYL